MNITQFHDGAPSLALCPTPTRWVPFVGFVAPGSVELVIILSLVFQLPVGVLLIVGGMQMRKLRSYRLAQIASVAGLLPCTSGFWLSLPIGIWSLMVLNRREVAGAFDTAAGAPPNRLHPKPLLEDHGKPLTEAELDVAMSQVRAPAIGLLIVALLTVLPVIAIIVMFIARFFFAGPGEPF